MRPYFEGPLRIGWTVARVRPPATWGIVIAKGTFDLVHGGRAKPSATPLPLSGDLYYGDDPALGVRYPSDFAPFKPKADAILVGHAHAPGGRPTDVMRVGFHVGSFSKLLAIIGERIKTKRWLGDSIPPPEPFRKIELTYTNAFGGAGFKLNPIGTGLHEIEGAEGRCKRLPNIEPIDKRVIDTDAGKVLPPAGFGPIDLTWFERIRYAGTYDKKWAKERWPDFPGDFDWRFFNAAPPDQQSRSYLKGNEPLRAENLHPEIPSLQTSLPAVRVRCFHGDADLRLVEVPMDLDTLWVDMDALRLVLVWRGHVELPHGDFDDEDLVAAFAEPMDAPVRPVAEYEARMKGEFAEAEEEEEEAPEEERPAPAPVAPPAVEVPAEEEPEEPEPPAKDVPPAEIEKLLVSLGLAVPEEIPEPPPPAPVPAEPKAASEPETRDFRGKSLKGADFTGARLAGADFTDCDLTKAKFARADLTGARFLRANLEEACLDGAAAGECLFVRANLRRASGAGARLGYSNFSSADLTEAKFPDALLADGNFHDTILAKVDLTGASLERSWGNRVRADGAILAGLKAAGSAFGESSFRSVAAPGSVWEKARLYRGDFRDAVLDGAEFEGAVLLEAAFTKASLKGARLVAANLRRSDLVRANLFRANLERTVLTGADLSEANLFEAGFHRAVLEGAQWSGANVRKTALEPA